MHLRRTAFALLLSSRAAARHETCRFRCREEQRERELWKEEEAGRIKSCLTVRIEALRRKWPVDFNCWQYPKKLTSIATSEVDAATLTAFEAAAEVAG